MHTSFIVFNLVFALLVGLFWLLFRQKSYFQLNRFLLLVLIPLAILLPELPSFWPTEQSIQGAVELGMDQINSPLLAEPLTLQATSEVIQMNTWSLLDIMLMLYLFGLIYYTIRFLRQSYQLFHFINSARKQRTEDYILVTPQVTTMPFSFFNYLVLPQSAQPEVLRQQIIQHELVHIRQWHSMDILIANLLQIICWWNPIVWVYRELIEQNQEFLVDQTLLNAGVDAKDYQFNLLKVQLPNALPLLTNSYNFSFIKKRIRMMQSQLNPRKNWSSYTLFSLAIIPLLLFFGKPTTLTSSLLSSEDQNDILIVYDHNTTYQELAALKAPLEAAGFELLIEEFRSNQAGMITDINITINGVLEVEQMKSGYNVPLGKQPREFIFFFYLDPEGGNGCGGLSKQTLKQYLYKQKNIQFYALGNIPNKPSKLLKKLPTSSKNLSKAEKKFIRSNNYRGKNRVDESTKERSEGVEAFSMEYLNNLKAYAKTLKSQLNLDANYYLNGVKVDANAIQPQLKKITFQEIKRNIYDKEFDIIDEEIVALSFYLYD